MSSNMVKMSGKIIGGYKQDAPDNRDYKYSAISTADITIPQTVNLTGKCSPVEDQGQIGSCVGNGVAGCLEYLENLNGVDFVDLSRLFIYYNARMIEGTTPYDYGCYIRDGIKAVANYGVCTEKDWPYVPSKFATKPSKLCYENAISNKIVSYFRLNTLDDMINCLASRYPFVFGFQVYDYFMSAEMSEKGYLNIPTVLEKQLGGHCVMAVGYDLKTRRILVRNSWSSSWGKNGYFWMPMDYIESSLLSSDFWTIRK